MPQSSNNTQNLQNISFCAHQTVIIQGIMFVVVERGFLERRTRRLVKWTAEVKECMVKMMGVRGRRSGECRTDGQSIQDTNGPGNCMIIEIWNEDWLRMPTGAHYTFEWNSNKLVGVFTFQYSQSNRGTIRNGMAPLWSKSTDVVQIWVQFMAIPLYLAKENCCVIEVQNDWSIYRTYRLWSFKSHEQIIVFLLAAIAARLRDNNRCIQFSC